MEGLLHQNPSTATNGVKKPEKDMWFGAMICSNNHHSIPQFKAGKMAEDCSLGTVADDDNDLVNYQRPGPFLSDLYAFCDGIPVKRILADCFIIVNPNGNKVYNLSAS